MLIVLVIRPIARHILLTADRRRHIDLDTVDSLPASVLQTLLKLLPVNLPRFGLLLDHHPLTDLLPPLPHLELLALLLQPLFLHLLLPLHLQRHQLFPLPLLLHLLP